MKLKTLAIAGLMASTSSMALADGVSIGMITTLSGGGAGLGIDVRDGFMLAIEQSGRDDIEMIIDTISITVQPRCCC